MSSPTDLESISLCFVNLFKIGFGAECILGLVKVENQIQLWLPPCLTFSRTFALTRQPLELAGCDGSIPPALGAGQL